METYRQGDVLLVPTTRPHGALARTSVTLAHGEATGHHHTFTEGAARGYRVAGHWERTTWKGAQRVKSRIGPFDSSATRRELASIIAVGSDGALLTHQEHDAITVAPGFYRVVRQHEWSAATASRSPRSANRRVFD